MLIVRLDDTSIYVLDVLRQVALPINISSIGPEHPRLHLIKAVISSDSRRAVLSFFYPGFPSHAGIVFIDCQSGSLLVAPCSGTILAMSFSQTFHEKRLCWLPGHETCIVPFEMGGDKAAQAVILGTLSMHDGALLLLNCRPINANGIRQVHGRAACEP